MDVGDWIVLDSGDVVEVAAVDNGAATAIRAIANPVPQPQARSAGIVVQSGWASEGVVNAIAEAMRHARAQPGTPIYFHIPDGES
jgi:hypothetical protein